MASAASLQFGQQLVTSSLPTALAQGSQLVVSPLSVWLALLLLFNGAGPSTPTYNELWSVVAGNATQFTGDATPLEALNTQVAALRNALSRQASGGTLNLTIADALWTKGVSLNPAYAGDMQRLFKAQAMSVSDATPINQWAANVTNGLIREVIPAKQAFDMVPSKYTAVRLPYKGSEGLAAVFVLPDESYSSIGDFAGSVTGATVLDPVAWGPLPAEKLSLKMPKFKIEARLGLTQALQAMGVHAAFSPGADFSKAVQSPLFLSDVRQATVVEVDEEGTEAAAVTMIAVGSAPGPKKPPMLLVFDRPFLFFVVETTTQTVLFQGVITDPSSK